MPFSSMFYIVDNSYGSENQHLGKKCEHEATIITAISSVSSNSALCTVVLVAIVHCTVVHVITTITQY